MWEQTREQMNKPNPPDLNLIPVDQQAAVFAQYQRDLKKYNNFLNQEEKEAIKKEIRFHNLKNRPAEEKVLFSAKYGAKFWDDELSLIHKENKDGTLKSVAINPSMVKNYLSLIPKLGIEIKLNVFSNIVMYNGKPYSDDDVSASTIDFEDLFDARVDEQKLKSAVKCEAIKNEFDPLRDYFVNLPTVNTNYLDNWLTTICGAEDNEINRIIGRKWLVQAVARGMINASYHNIGQVNYTSYNEGVLILKGLQGGGKSDVFRTLCPKIEYFHDNGFDLCNPQSAAIALAGRFIIEFAELSSLNKASIEETKQFITSLEFDYTPKFSNLNRRMPKRQVFAATTNNDSFLTDMSGNRRFWCVKVADTFNIELLEKIKDNLWAEAKQIYMQYPDRMPQANGGSKLNWWVMNTNDIQLLNESNEQFMVHNELLDKIQEHIQSNFVTEITPQEVQDIAKKIDPNKKGLQYEIPRIMDKLGFKKIKSNGKNYYKAGNQNSDIKINNSPSTLDEQQIENLIKGNL